MGAHQFKHGWAYNTDVTLPSPAPNLLLAAPPVGVTRSLEVFRLIYTGAAIVWFFLFLPVGGGGSIFLDSQPRAAGGSFASFGPWTQTSGFSLHVNPWIVTATSASATVDYVEY